MLNLNEYNESLYKALDKKNRKKNMVENYGQFLMHAKKTSGVTNLPDKTWLTDEVRDAISEAYKVLNKKSMQVNESNDPSVIYDACRGEISVLAKLIRKANAGGLDSSYITQLNNYRNELESRAEEARSAMSRENQSSKVARHSEEAGEALEHGEKWRKHKYIRIENGRYIYPEDIEKMGKQNTYLNNMAKKEKAAADAQQKANYEKNKAAAEAMSQNNQKNSTVVKNQQKSDYEKNKAAAEAMTWKQQANSTVVKNQQQSDYEKNKAAAEAMGEREANKNKPDPVADAKAVFEYKKKKSVEEYNNAVNKLQEESANRANEAKQKAQAEYDSRVAEMNREIEERKKKAKNAGTKVAKTVQKVGKAVYDSIFHSSFSISDEEMEAFLAHKAN